jgi:hypothetical protein
MTAPILDIRQTITPEDLEFLNRFNEIKKTLNQEPIDIEAMKNRSQLFKNLEDARLVLEDCGQATKQLQDAVRDARHKNLRLMVMGTMKAGKSTALCALIGYSLALIRDSAATSIPIGYEHDPNSKQPRVEVSEDFNENTRRGLESVKKRILEQTLRAVRSKLKSHSQAKDLLKEIHEQSLDTLLSLPAEGDSEQICKYLKKISDYHRIFSMLEVEGITITDYPKVVTPFYGIRKQLNGTCTIFDTPGRDDTGGFNSAQFQEVQDSSPKTVVMVDYSTGIGGKGYEEDVKPLCKEISDRRGAPNLIVVVNKIDQRNESGGTTTEQIVEKFQTDFGVTREQIIEVSASRALSSSSVCRDLSIFPPSTPLKDIKSVRELAKKAYTLTWEQWLETASRDDVLKAADQFWKLSGFDRLVEAIETTIEDCEKETFKAAITAAEYSLLECIEGISESQKDSRSKQEHIKETAARQLKEIADIVVKLDNLRVDSVNRFRETYENETATILSSSLKFYNADEAKNHLEQIKQACLQTADRVWNTIQQDLVNNFQEVQQQIIDRGKEIGLEFPPVTLDGCTIAFSIDELLDPLYEPEEYQTQVAVPKTEWVTKTHKQLRWVENLVPGFGFWSWDDVEVQVPVHSIDTVTMTNTRDVFVLQRNHKDRTIDLVNSQVGNCLESPALKETLSLSNFKVQLDQHLTKTAEDYESNHRSSILLQSRAEDQLKRIQADLDVVNS